MISSVNLPGDSADAFLFSVAFHASSTYPLLLSVNAMRADGNTGALPEKIVVSSEEVLIPSADAVTFSENAGASVEDTRVLSGEVLRKACKAYGEPIVACRKAWLQATDSERVTSTRHCEGGFATDLSRFYREAIPGKSKTRKVNIRR